MAEFKEQYTGNGKVYLLNKGNKIYTDIAARFVRSERPVAEIIDSPYSPEIVRNILESGHMAATEFDYFIFGVEGYSRACEAQLIRKRHGSYLIKSGRQELKGKRAFSMVAPKEIYDATAEIEILNEKWELSGRVIMKIINQWYDQNLEKGLPEEDLRLMKPQATEFKAIIGFNAHALIDISRIRMCYNAQHEIRDMVTKMVNLAKEVAPDLMKYAGPNCKHHGYCTEGKYQCAKYKGIIPTKEELMHGYAEYKKSLKHEVSNIEEHVHSFGDE